MDFEGSLAQFVGAFFRIPFLVVPPSQATRLHYESSITTWHPAHWSTSPSKHV